MRNPDHTGLPVGADHQNLFRCFQVLRELPQLLNQLNMIRIGPARLRASPMKEENNPSHLQS